MVAIRFIDPHLAIVIDIKVSIVVEISDRSLPDFDIHT